MRKNILVILTLFFALSYAAPSAYAARSLSVGSSGSDVQTLQNILIAKGYLATGKASGYFGPLTQAAIKNFQCAQNIICSGTTGYGIYGPRTQAALASGGLSPGSSQKALEFSGWIPYWRTASGTKDVLPHLPQLTSVMPFGYTMKNDGTLADTAKLAEEPWTSFIAEAKRNKVRVIPTVMWGNGDSIHRILSNTTTRIALEDEIAKVVMENNFDGIDIDFEAKKFETVNYFSTFLKGLYARMGNKWVYCTIEARMPLSHRFSPGAKIPPDAMDYANDYTAINKYCDRVEIMAYDQGTIDIKLNNIRSAPYAPIADPAWVEALVTLAAEKIAKNKIIIGVPTYGYEYKVTPLAGSGFEYKVLWPFNPRYATEIASKLGITPNRTSANEIGFMYSPSALAALAPTGSESTQTQQAAPTTSITQNSGTQTNAAETIYYLSWSDKQAIADKVALARRLGVRGIAVFKFDGGQDSGMWDVLK